MVTKRKIKRKPEYDGNWEDKFIDGYWQRVWIGEGLPPGRAKAKPKPAKGPSYPKKFKESLDIYMKHGAKRRGASKKYSDRQLRIKRLIWALNLKLGGYTATLKALKMTASGVSRWVERESIPMKHYKNISFLLDGKIEVGDIAKIVLAD